MFFHIKTGTSFLFVVWFFFKGLSCVLVKEAVKDIN